MEHLEQQDYDRPALRDLRREARQEDTPFEIEAARVDFGPRFCPGWNHAECVTQISGAAYYCPDCAVRRAEFVEQLRRELRK